LFYEKFGPYDWVIFGSPCQSFSFAGSQTGLDGKSGLLVDCVKILNWAKEFNPEVKYLIENVNMKKEFLDQFDAIVGGGERVRINSSKLSAQKRDRYYWTNFKVGAPADLGIVLKDILEPQVDLSLYFTPKNIELVTDSRICGDIPQKSNVGVYEFVDRDKSYCIDANYHKGTTLRQYIEKSRRQVVFAYSSSTRENKVIESRSNLGGKGNTLTTQEGCGGHYSQNLVADILDKEIIFRKLTVRECARLQTIPEWYDFSCVSKTQGYKAIGNGWTVDVIVHIFEYGLGIKSVEAWECL